VQEENRQMSRSNWSRPLPAPLVIPEVATLRTLGDVRTLIDRHLPRAYRERPQWRTVTVHLAEAARGADPRPPPSG
jgi:hypothetical protein